MAQPDPPPGRLWHRLWAWLRPSAAPTPETAAPGAARPTLPPARWLAADNNRYGLPVLDLHSVLHGVQSTTTDRAVARQAVSWGARIGDDLPTTIVSAHHWTGALAYPCAADLPDGLLYTPAAMEDKWVLVRRAGEILVVRSWTGQVHAVARAAQNDEQLCIDQIDFIDGPLTRYGHPAELFDWLLRTHALNEDHPLPLSDTGLEAFAAQPALAFGAFGRKALAAARRWRPPPPQRPLRSDGAVLLAVRREDTDALRALHAAGASLQPPGTWSGFTPLHVAAVKGSLPLVEQLITLGAAPDPTSDDGHTPFLTAIVHHGAIPVLECLLAAGASPGATNADGFGALHAAVEVHRPELVPWLLSLGLSTEDRTGRMQTALHLAAGLGHREVAEALVSAGADSGARSPWGTPAEIARAEEHPELAAWLDALSGS